MSQQVSRAVRLTKIEQALRARKGGMSAVELAQYTDMHVRTIQRDLRTMQNEQFLALRKDGARWALDDERLPKAELDLQEARALLIATRLFMRHTGEQDMSAAAALRKLARIMPAQVRDQVLAASARMEGALDLTFSRNLAEVTDAWARHCVLNMTYRSAGHDRPKDVVLEPYFLEPTSFGFSTYVIGYSRTHKSMRTFKVQRIVSAKRTPERFQIPDSADIDELLANAWEIVFGEGITVRMRFTKETAWRAKEGRWHPSQQIDDTPGGGCEMVVKVASLQEVGRWVRGWGAGVEVLEPQELREELRGESIALARLYAAAPKRQRKTRSHAKPRATSNGATPMLPQIEAPSA
ncbi:MAG: WYL domain-containing transcriptional regulator [Chloroflexi bacterium]|nr:WYL domain-containing transcriptional regulator [Chloroflexota bacterium]